MMGLRRAARPALVAAALLGLCGWVGRGPRAPLEAALLSAAAGDGAGRIYKVTFLSLNASADGAFLERVGGFSGVTDVWHRNVGGAAAGAACAVRQTAEALGTVQIHLVEDGFAAGAVPAEAWVDGCFNALHGDLGAPAWGGWDDFMSAGTAFYYDDLTPVAAAAARDGTPFVGRRYANPRDGLPMYAMFLNLPRSGSIVEFHSAALDGRLAEAHFSGPRARAQARGAARGAPRREAPRARGATGEQGRRGRRRRRGPAPDLGPGLRAQAREAATVEEGAVPRRRARGQLRRLLLARPGPLRPSPRAAPAAAHRPRASFSARAATYGFRLCFFGDIYCTFTAR